MTPKPMSARTVRSLPLWFYCYGVFTQVITPLWRMLLNRRLSQGKETSLSISQKLMLNPPLKPDAEIIWGHAVGVGEALALAGLFSQMAESLPAHHFLITSSASTSAQALLGGQLPPRCTHQFSPIDTPDAVTAFLNHWQPSMAIWCEMDIWPCLMGQTYQRGIPMLLVNARLSEKSFKKRKLGAWLYKDLLRQFDHIYCQNQETKDSLILLGAKQTSIDVVGSIKQIAQPLNCNEIELSHLRALIRDRPCWLLASSHEGEELFAIEAHAYVLTRFPNALLIIAPRYPHRGNSLAINFNLHHSQRSFGASPLNTTTIYLADTIGEMGLWYRLASIALIGGSLVEIGGHNPFEALQLKCQVLHGPYVENFSESYELLSVNHKSELVETIDQLGKRICNSFSDAAEQVAPNIEKNLTNFLKDLVHYSRKKCTAEISK